MTNQEAIYRLERHDLYLQQRIQQRHAEGLPAKHQEADRESIALALAAIRYVIEVEEYEASQQPLE